MPLWRGGPNTRTLPTVLLTPSASKAADMAHLCVPQNQALGVCRGFAPDIQICGTHGRKNLVNATIISNAEEEEEARHWLCDAQDFLAAGIQGRTDRTTEPISTQTEQDCSRTVSQAARAKGRARDGEHCVCRSHIGILFHSPQIFSVCKS